MKNMNKLFVGLLLVFGLMALASYNSNAVTVARSPKHSYLYSYSVAITSVTPFTVLQATSTLQAQPGAVYELNLSTGTAGDYIILFDSIPYSAASLANNGTANNNAYQLGPRFYFGSTTANTKITFDPPLEFYNGLMVIGSSNTEQASVTYEVGRGLSGQ